MRFLFNALAEIYEVDPSVIDLVLWFPHLTWGQFLAATFGVIVWSWLSAQISKALGAILRSYLFALARTVISRLAEFPGLGFLRALIKQPWLAARSSQQKTMTRNHHGTAIQSKKTNASCSWPLPSASSTNGSLSPAPRTHARRRYSSRPYAASSFPHPFQAGGRRLRGGRGYLAM